MSPHLPSLIFSCSGNLFMSQLDKLIAIAGRENKLTKHELFIDGEDLTFWSKPMTIAEFQLAKKQSKNTDDLLESTARLFVMKAMDEAGRPQYQTDAIPFLMNALSLKTASKLLKAMNDEDEEDEVVRFDMKSSEAPAQKGKPAAA